MADTLNEFKGKGKGKIADQVAQIQKSVDYAAFEQRVSTAATDLTNSVETTVGRSVEEIRGGVESITAEFDAKVNSVKDLTTEGILDEGTQALENMKNDAINSAISSLASKFGSKVEIQFSEPDSNGFTTIESTSLEPEGGLSATISGILQLITGLGTGDLSGQALQDTITEGATDLGGKLQEQVISAATEGVVDAVARVEGKVGAFSSVEALADTLDNSITGITNQIPTPDDINQSLSVPLDASAIDSDGSGNAVITRSTVSSVNTLSPVTEMNTFKNNITANSKADVTAIFTGTELKKNVDGLKRDITELTGGKNADEVLRSTERLSQSIGAVEQAGNEYAGLINRVAGGSSRGNVQSVSIAVNPQVTKNLQISAPTLTPEELDRVLDLAQSGDESKISEAADILKANSTTKSYEDLLEQVRQINTTITENNKLIEDYDVFGAPYEIGSASQNWNGGRGDPDFPYISSVEELNAEFQKISRNITSMIVHWTETHTNRNIGSEEINQYHLDLGIEGIGYHYVIRRDGSIQRGRPVNLDGDHTPNFNTGSIGVVFVGGINAPTGTENSENFISAQSLTRTQVNSFDHLCRAFLNRFDKGYIFGHNDLDEDEFDPGFDVIEYVKSRFSVADYSEEDL
jgi:N-acetylmuramoyl-L-alanine amidase